jgi:hypothetical protein
MSTTRSPARRARRAAAIAALLAVGGAPVLLVTLLGSFDPGQPNPGGPAEGRLPEGPSRGSAPRSPAPARGEPARPRFPEVEWRQSVAVGVPEAGRLVRGVRLPREGRHFFTWDPIERRSPNRPWRRWGTDDLVRTTIRILADFGRAHRGAPRLGVGDLSRPHGGDFGPQYGFIGHATHQNGLDVDIYYPLENGRERAPRSVEEVDLRLSQDLVDRFLAAGAERVYVGPATGLAGPPGVVQAIPNHDNHLHVRIPPP